MAVVVDAFAEAVEEAARAAPREAPLGVRLVALGGDAVRIQEQVGILRNEAHLADEAGWRRGDWVEGGDLDAAGRGPDLAGERREQGRLAGTVAAHHGGDRAAGQLEVDAAQGLGDPAPNGQPGHRGRRRPVRGPVPVT